MKKIEWLFPEDEAGNGKTLLEGILYQRGIQEVAAQEEFLSDRPQLIYDPFLLEDMEEAVCLLYRAIEKEEKICIYGDYDADGVTSCTLLFTILKKVTEQVTYYIPSRFDEGYGLNKEAIQCIASEGVKLLITVDCGSTSLAEIELARQLGMAVVVTDHHNMNDVTVPNCLLVNPKRPNGNYPFKELSGCGVAFKLAQALQQKLTMEGDLRIRKSDITDTLDLVAVATIGDIVPLTGENRSLVKYGLNVLNQGKRPGFRALIEGVGLTLGNIKSEQVAYIIVPHLNAAGRMISAREGVELLIHTEEGGSTEQRRKDAVKFLLENNKKRKQIQGETFAECKDILEQKHREDLFQIIYSENAHEGIAGIVAGKLKDTYYKPTIVVTPSTEQYLKGTGRSIEGVDLYLALSNCRSLFERFGGHSGACGFLMKKENLETLRSNLNTYMQERLQERPDLFTEYMVVDAQVKAGELSFDLIQDMDRIGPFGHQNKEPLLVVKSVTIKNFTSMGQEGQHVRFQVQGTDGACFDCILFQRAEYYRGKIRKGNVIDVAGYPGLNIWNGKTKIQFVIRDIR